MKIIKKFFVIFPLLSLFLLTSCGTRHASSNIKSYEKYVDDIYDASKYMPKISEIGNYKSFKATTRLTIEFLFETETVALFIEYDSDEYLAQIKKINNKYSFLYEPNKYVYQARAEVNGYEFKVSTETGWKYSQEMLLIGIKENKIAYLYHYDSDLDYIDDLESFIKSKYYLA